MAERLILLVEGKDEKLVLEKLAPFGLSFPAFARSTNSVRKSRTKPKSGSTSRTVLRNFEIRACQ